MGSGIPVSLNEKTKMTSVIFFVADVANKRKSIDILGDQLADFDKMTLE